jgi:sphinganine-1-phosphate aldolase
VCLIASAPEYAFGFYDPIPQIAALAQKYGIGCHSDCCLGSYINPFTEEAGFKIPCEFDFKVPGVTSISCDPHKFCYGPKGLSVILYRTKELRRGTFFTISEWTGGMYVTPSLAGSRSGAVITGTWAALMKQGKQGFIDKAKTLLTAAHNIREAIKKSNGIQLISDHDNTVISFKSDVANCVAINDRMQKVHRWSLNTIQGPLSSHLVVTDANAQHWKEFVPCLEECLDFLKKNPEENDKGDAALYGLSEKIPNKGVVGEFIIYYLESILDAL